MFCRKCGKENPIGSNYCSNCGSRLYHTHPNNSFFEWLSNKINKQLAIVYGIWGLLHLTLFTFSFPTIYREAFYPFAGSINSYDISEFFFYTVIIPIVLWGLKACAQIFFSKSNIRIAINWISKHIVPISAYILWGIIHTIIYIKSLNELSYGKGDFYPFYYDYYSYKIDFNYIGSYDSSEFFFYVMILPFAIMLLSYFASFLIRGFRDNEKHIDHFEKAGFNINTNKIINTIKKLLTKNQLPTIHYNIRETESYRLLLKWLLIDSAFFGISLLIYVALWIFWLLYSFGPMSMISGGVFINGSITILVLILVSDTVILFLTFYRHRNVKAWFYHILSFLSIEILIIGFGNILHSFDIWEFQDYTIKAKNCLLITNVIVLIMFYLILPFLKTRKKT